MANNSEKLIKEFQILSRNINKLDENLSDYHLQISLGVNNEKKYQNLTKDFFAIKKNIHYCQQQVKPNTPTPYLVFLDLKCCFNGLKNKIEMTKYLLMLFSQLNKK